MDRIDCFARYEANEIVKCSALDIKHCEDCAFYKTTEQVKKERAKSVNTLKVVGLYNKAVKKYGDIENIVDKRD